MIIKKKGLFAKITDFRHILKAAAPIADSIQTTSPGRDSFASIFDVIATPERIMRRAQ